MGSTGSECPLARAGAGRARTHSMDFRPFGRVAARAAELVDMNAGKPSASCIRALR